MGDLGALLADPRHPGWGGPPLPDWVRALRPAQKDAVQEVVGAFEQGVKFVVLSAPTGSGKSLVGELVRRALGIRGRYVCVDRGLQDQVLRDFPYAAVLKGRANYPTLDAPERYAPPERLSCDDCTSNFRMKPCRWCSDKKMCPYRVAKRAAEGADLAVLNTAYLLAEANAGGAFSDGDLVIADECDRLEGALMTYVSVAVGARRLEEWSIDPLPGGSAPEPTAAWVDLVAAAAEKSIGALRARDPEASDLRTQRELRALRRLRAGLQRVQDELPGGGWVTAQVRGAVEFKPVRVSADAGPALWRHADRWLLMSATVLSAQGMLADLGVEDPWSWAEVDLPSPFPRENRQVHLLGVADVVRANSAAAVSIASALEKILEHHAADRVLVHTVSFRLQADLERLLRPSPRYVWYRGSLDRAEALRGYLARPGAVLFAPALERGLDLPDDMCRAIVVCKVPWPDLGDVQVAARTARPGGSAWYRRQALRSLVQMTGRGVRHEADRCETYVLDCQADRIVKQGRGDLPVWWLESLVANENSFLRGGPG